MNKKSDWEMHLWEMDEVLEALGASENFNRQLPIELSDSYVRVEEDGMGAWLYLEARPEGYIPYSREEIVDFLMSQGVIAGFHESNISAVAKKKIYEREILIAVGQEPLEGKEGYYDYAFEAEMVKQPSIREDGTADYTSLTRISNVCEGDIIARYHPSIPGRNGYTVSGKEIKVRRVTDRPALRGAVNRDKNDPNIYYASMEGGIELIDYMIDIQKVLEIDGNVDQILGKVEFAGDIIVTGSVESGVVIRASRNIVIQRSVAAATLFSGGDVFIARGVQGQQQAKISAKGNVTAGFIEHSIIKAGGDIMAGCIINSRIAVEGKVVLSGRRGSLVGGYVHALRGVWAITVGNDVEVRTEIHVGCEAEIYYKEISLRKQVAQVGINQSSQAEFQELLQELKELQAYIEKGKGAQIYIDGNIYKGTVVRIMHMEMPIERNTCYMKYDIQGSKIVGNVIVHA